MITGTSRFGNFSRGPLPAVFALVFFAALPAAAQSAWVIADFDGDQKSDLVTLGDVLHSAPGIRAGLFDDGALALSSRFPAHRLRARDLDGDSDRDLVLESESSVAIAVWINDGTGHFEPGRLEDYQLQTDTEDSQTWDSSPRVPRSELTDEGSRGNASGPPGNFGPMPVRVHHPRMAEHAARAAFLHSLRTRGPPARS